MAASSVRGRAILLALLWLALAAPACDDPRPGLYELVRAESAAARTYAVIRLAGIGAYEDFHLVAARLEDPDEQVRLAAIRGVISLDDPDGPPLLLEALPAAGDRERQAILSWLVARRPAGGVGALKALTRRGKTGAWKDAWVALGRLGELDALKPLLADLRSDEPHPETLSALGSLARAVGYERLWEGFREAPLTEMVPVFEPWGEPAAPALAALLEEAGIEEDLRVALLGALGRTAPDQALPVLRSALLEGSARTQHAALGLLTARRDARAARVLLEALGVESCRIRDEVADALARLGDRVPDDELELALDDPARRLAVLDPILVRRGDRTAVRLAAEHAVDAEPEVRARVAAVLAAHGAAEHLGHLIELGNDADSTVQRAGRRALAGLLARLLGRDRREEEIAELAADQGPRLALAAETMLAALEDEQGEIASAAGRALLLMAERVPGPAGLRDKTTRAIVAARMSQEVGAGSAVEDLALELIALSRAGRVEGILREQFIQAVSLLALSPRAEPADHEHALMMPIPEGLARARERMLRRRADVVCPERLARLIAAMAGHGSLRFVEVATRLLQAPSTSSPAARRAAARLLAGLGLPPVPACAVAAEFPAEGDEVARYLLLNVLARCEDDESRLILVRAASRRGADPHLLEAALAALFRDGTAAAIEALRHGSEAVRRGALAALDRVSSPEELELVAGEEEAELMALAAAVAGQRDDPEARVRAWAARVSGVLMRATDDGEGLETLFGLTDDVEASVRAAALGAIFDGTPERQQSKLLDRIEHLVVDPAQEVRLALARGLSAWGSEDADQRLILLVADADDAVRLAATRGLAAHARVGFAANLLDAAEAGPREVTLAAVAGLAAIGEGEAIQALCSLLEGDEDLEVRRAAVEALGDPALGAAAAAALRRQLHAGPAEIRWLAVQGLLEIDGKGGARAAEARPVDDADGSEDPGIPEAAVPETRVPAPPAVIRARDVPDDGGRAIEVRWRLSPDDPTASGAAADGNAFGYSVLRGRSAEGSFHVVAELPAGTTRFRDDRPGLSDGTSYRYRIQAAVGPLASLSAVSAPVTPRGQWFHTGRVAVLVVVVLFSALVMLFVRAARQRPERLYVRPLPGLEALEEAIGRATEMGRPVLYSTGLGEISDIGTLASISILSSVSRTAAEYGARLRVPCRDPVVFAATQEAVEEGCLAAGRPDAYDPADVFFVAGRQFAYAAAVSGIMIRERTAANLFVGLFYAEALLLAETGAETGAIQIAATDRVTQLPFFITSCDYTLIGEELYAAGAYLGRDPALLGGLKAQDWAKALLMAVLGVGALLAGLAAAGIGWFDTLKQGLLGLLGSS